MSAPSRFRVRKENSLKATAYHEAGHAVMAFWLGRAIRKVTIEPTVDAYGSVTYFAHPSMDPDLAFSDPRTRRKVEGMILCAMAGAVAENIHLGRSTKWGPQGDYQTAVNLALIATGSPEEAGAFIQWLTLRARNILSTPSSKQMLGDLVGALLARKRLSGPETRALLREAMRMRRAKP